MDVHWDKLSSTAATQDTSVAPRANFEAPGMALKKRVPSQTAAKGKVNASVQTAPHAAKRAGPKWSKTSNFCCHTDFTLREAQPNRTSRTASREELCSPRTHKAPPKHAMMTGTALFQVGVRLPSASSKQYVTTGVQEPSIVTKLTLA
mmetsp:Transcript_26705/g.47085  ORF Transcript_26705/g.47085 Transcript_26705/m.47085 type:complete len:148 (+) Transcript_26705:379-822(+)